MGIPTTPPSGFRDFLPDACAARADAIARISRVYRSFGFQQIATSAVEELSVLLGKGGGENEKLIFKLLKRGEKLENAIKEGQELADLGLRFDLTLPLARYFSKHGSQLPHPFKAFNIGPVWRAERAQKGRYREFYQCDVDVLGSDGISAEIDVICAQLAAFEELGLSPAVLINDRGLLLDRIERAGVPKDKIAAACVALDKLDKIGEAGVLEELKAQGLPETLIAHDVAGAPAARDPQSERLRAIEAGVNKLVGRAAAVFSPNLVRGFDYYTSTVFEYRIQGAAGSVGGGGRYDRLTENFGGPPVPAVGGSIGFERVLLLLEEKGATQVSGPDYVVAVFSEETRAAAFEAAAALRKSGKSVDVYPGTGKLKAQFKYADQKKAKHVLIIGPDEAAQGIVKVKALATGEEKTHRLAELA